MAISLSKTRVEYYDKIETSDVSWLWYPYIPYGKVTILQGDPGEGKTTMMLQIAANLTSGRSIPDGKDAVRPQNVIFQGAEDGPGDTIKPRLMRAGADCSRVAYIDVKGEPNLYLGDDRFRNAIRECDARLLIIDPLQAFIRGSSELQHAGGLRRAFRKLTDDAEETGCAIVLIGHMNKNSSGKSIYRGLGSIDVAAAARSILMIGRDHSDPHLRIMIPVKTSLATEGKPYAFRLDPKKWFEWIGECDCEITDNQIIASRPGKKLDQAKKYLELMLIQDQPSTRVMEEMSNLGIGRRTVETAKKELGVASYREGNTWFWHLKRKLVDDQ